MMQKPPLLPLAERRANGQAHRSIISRSSHGQWSPAKDRADPIARLIDASKTRIPALLPLHWGRMSVDAFAFLRGAAPVMAADLGALEVNTRLVTQLGGDQHLANFGAVAGIAGDALFDVNDFDETLQGPFEWDLKRLAASLVVAGQTQDMPDKACRALARRAVHAYRREIHDLANVAPFAAWNSRVSLEAAVEDIGDRDIRKFERHRLNQIVQSGIDGNRHLISSSGTLRLPERPPGVYRLGAHEAVAHEAFAAYEASLPPERAVLLSRYRLHDVAFKAVGVGSVGTFCAIGLYATPEGDTLLLQLKEAVASCLAPYAGPSRYAHQGERVVVGQRMLQAEPDLFLGWTQAEGRDFYVRRLKDPRLAAIGTDIEAQALPFYAKLCGRTLARAHARAGDAAEIAGYLGDGDSFDEAIAQFALTYADQNALDFARFTQAIAERKLDVILEKK